MKNGQKLSTDTAKAAVFANMLRGEALRVFEIRRKQHTLDNTSNNFDTVVQEVTKYFFPERALIDQERFLRHYNRKKPSMMVREYVARLQDINQKLNQFPPFANQAMSDNELIEILEYSMPHVWNVEMRAHGFVPHTKTLSEVVEFYERTKILEKVWGFNLHQGQGNSKRKVANSGSEKVQTDSGKSSRKGSIWNASKTSNDKPDKMSKSNKFCAYHNTSGHDFSECKVMLDQAQKMRANWETHRRNPTQGGTQKNSTSKTVSFGKESNLMTTNQVSPKKRKHETSSSVVNDDVF